MRRRPLPNALDVDQPGGLTDRVTPSAGVALLIGAPSHHDAVPHAPPGRSGMSSRLPQDGAQPPGARHRFGKWTS